MKNLKKLEELGVDYKFELPVSMKSSSPQIILDLCGKKQCFFVHYILLQTNAKIDEALKQSEADKEKYEKKQAEIKAVSMN